MLSKLLQDTPQQKEPEFKKVCVWLAQIYSRLPSFNEATRALHSKDFR